MKNPPLVALFTLKTDVLEVAGIPERIKVPFNGSLIVDVSGLAENSSLNRVYRNAPIAMNFNIDDEVVLSDDGRREKENRQ